MEHRGFGTGSLALIVTGHRLLGEALGYVLRLRGGLHCSLVLSSLDDAEATRLLARATIVLVDEERMRDRCVSERLTRDLRGPPLVVIAREGVSRDASDETPSVPMVSCQATVDDLICCLRRAASRGRLPIALERTQEMLSPREQEIIALVGAGLSNREISGRLGVSVATVKNHVHHVLTKLHARSRWQAAAAVRDE